VGGVDSLMKQGVVLMTRSYVDVSLMKQGVVGVLVHRLIYQGVVGLLILFFDFN
jgi:hypothetical protein